MSEWFEVGKGVRQGCILSPYLFNIYAENIMRNFREDPEKYNDAAEPEHDTYDSLNIGCKSLRLCLVFLVIVGFLTPLDPLIFRM